jgi:RecB family exonuclease
MGAALDRRMLERLAEQPVETRIGWPAPNDPRRAIDETEYDLARLRPVAAGELTPGLAAYLIKINPTLARSMRTRWQRWGRSWSSVDGLIIQKVEERNPLEKYRLSARAYAPSTLQKFAMCPYRFGLSAVLGLTPMKEAAPLERLDRQTRGTLFHDVLKCFIPKVGNYPDSAEALQNACAVLDATLEEVCSQYTEELAPAIDEVWKNEIERFRADLRSWLVTVSSETLWRPLEVERTFDDLIVDQVWRLRGRMDLTEERTDGSLRVTDYKTGAYPKEPPKVIGGGEVLQPLLYAMAAEQLYPGKTVVGGQLFFATLRGGYRTVPITLDDATRAEAGRVLSTIDGELKRGFLPASPREKACENCDYLVVCGPYEEERAQRKPVDKIRALVQMRGVK